jgi:hypothetical protein
MRKRTCRRPLSHPLQLYNMFLHFPYLTACRPPFASSSSSSSSSSVASVLPRPCPPSRCSPQSPSLPPRLLFIRRRSPRHRRSLRRRWRGNCCRRSWHLLKVPYWLFFALSPLLSVLEFLPQLAQFLLTLFVVGRGEDLKDPLTEVDRSLLLVNDVAAADDLMINAFSVGGGLGVLGQNSPNFRLNFATCVNKCYIFWIYILLGLCRTTSVSQKLKINWLIPSLL